MDALGMLSFFFQQVVFVFKKSGCLKKWGPKGEDIKPFPFGKGLGRFSLVSLTQDSLLDCRVQAPFFVVLFLSV